MKKQKQMKYKTTCKDTCYKTTAESVGRKDCGEIDITVRIMKLYALAKIFAENFGPRPDP